jgi:transcription initiation factor TFIIIB Brf1 subunit/transcription initiation factor TFIIB
MIRLSMKGNLKKLCAECGSDNVIYDREKDQSICQDCGSIFEELAPEDEDDFEEVFNEKVPKHAKVKAAAKTKKKKKK